MVSIVVLSKDKHKNLRVKTNNDLIHMKAQNVVSVSIKEMNRASNNFPVVFIKLPNSDQYRLVALLGFTAGENLFYDKEEWKCSYAPLVMLRLPFAIGPAEDGDDKKLVTCLDEDSEFLNETEGSALYNDDGSETDFLKGSQQLLAEIFDGEVRTHKFVQRMLQLDLITGFEIGTTTMSGKVNRYSGILSINEEKLKALDSDTILDLHKSNYLPVIYMMLSSMSQVNLLVKLKNQVSEDKIVHFQIVPQPQEEEASNT